MPRERLSDLVDALAVPVLPHSLECGRHALWSNGIALLEPHAVPEALTSLHAATAVALRRLDLPVETRPYRPHVTFARRATGSVRPTTAPRFSWPVDGHALVESRPGGDYVPLHCYS